MPIILIFIAMLERHFSFSLKLIAAISKPTAEFLSLLASFIQLSSLEKDSAFASLYLHHTNALSYLNGLSF